MRASGISTGFPVLSQSSGQVAHVVLTRSPLGLHQCCHRLNLVRLACIRHAASVRPEPGSNSPSRPLGKQASREIREPIGFDSASDWRRRDRGRSATVFLTVGTMRQTPSSRPHWLLALALPFSRSGRARASRRRCQALWGATDPRVRHACSRCWADAATAEGGP